MFVSDAHLYVQREVNWKSLLALRFTNHRRRKSLMRRVRRDLRTALPFVALVFTFVVTLATAEFANSAKPRVSQAGQMQIAMHLPPPLVR
jgi:hypothetical protein